MTFEQQWESAKYNWLYWLTWAAMLVLPLVCAVIASRWTAVDRTRRRARVGWMGIGLFVSIAFLSLCSIDLKWHLRREAAETAEQRSIVAEHDTGNLVFSPIIGGRDGALAVLMYAGLTMGARFITDSANPLREQLAG